MTKELMGFSNYGVKILLDLAKICKLLFFDNYGVKVLLDLVKILQIAFFDTLYFLN